MNCNMCELLRICYICPAGAPPGVAVAVAGPLGHARGWWGLVGAGCACTAAGGAPAGRLGSGGGIIGLLCGCHAPYGGSVSIWAGLSSHHDVMGPYLDPKPYHSLTEPTAALWSVMQQRCTLQTADVCARPELVLHSCGGRGHQPHDGQQTTIDQA